MCCIDVFITKFVFYYVIAITDLLVEFRKLEFRVSVLEGNKPTVSFII